MTTRGLDVSRTKYRIVSYNSFNVLVDQEVQLLTKKVILSTGQIDLFKSLTRHFDNVSGDQLARSNHLDTVLAGSDDLQLILGFSHRLIILGYRTLAISGSYSFRASIADSALRS